MSDFNMFKKPELPAKKRKLEPPVQSPLDRYKSAKVQSNGSGSAEKKATVTDEAEDDDDGEAGPSMPMDEDNEEYPEDDEGRLEGGGLTEREQEILDYMDKNDEVAAAEEKIDVSWLRKMALNFEKKVSKNAEMRAKHEDDPHKFMASEAELDGDIKALAILAEHPELYKEFVRLGCVGSLVGLLAHENSDIAIDVLEVIVDLTSDEVEGEEWDTLVKGMVDAQLLDMLTQNLSRLREENEQDKNGIYHTLNIFENLVSQVAYAEMISEKTNLIAWILERIKIRESPISQNKQYSAEVLSIVVQTAPASRKWLIGQNGIDVLLQLLSSYRKRDPIKGGEEEEYFENLFDCLTCLVDEEDGKTKFVESEGIELCLIMLREGKMSKDRALRVIDHAVGGEYGSSVCERVVEAQGLKTMFGMFMKKLEADTTEHLLGIFASLLRNLPADSAPRIRTLAKFVEKDYEKISKLVKLRDGYDKRYSAIEAEIKLERQNMGQDEIDEEVEAEWLSKRLMGGLFCLQMVDTILAWLSAEDDGARTRVKEVLSQANKTTEDVKKTLVEQVETMDDSTNEAKNTKEMLQILIDLL